MNFVIALNVSYRIVFVIDVMLNMCTLNVRFYAMKTLIFRLIFTRSNVYRSNVITQWHFHVVLQRIKRKILNIKSQCLCTFQFSKRKNTFLLDKLFF